MKTLTDIKHLLDQLNGQSADDLESETLEFKSWDSHAQAWDSQIRSLRETVVALANQQGGMILLGVADRKHTRHEAIHGVPSDLDLEQLRVAIFKGTDPGILVEVRHLDTGEGKRVVAVDVPRGVPPHTTSEGVGKIRVGKENQPLTGARLVQLAMVSGQRDFTAGYLDGASQEDLDPEQIKLLKRQLKTEGNQGDLADLPTAELLSNLGLTQGDKITYAAVLLLGTPRALARYCPQHQVSFIRFKSQIEYEQRIDMKGPLLQVLEALKRLLEPHLATTVVHEGQGLRETAVLDFEWPMLREAALNALAHRDYFVNQSVIISLHGDRLEIANPGGFLGGISPENIIRHPPVHRNGLLADVLHKTGYINRVSVGVDRIFDAMLRSGRPSPRYESDISHVKLILKRKVHAPFLRLVSERIGRGTPFSLDDLLLLRACLEIGALDRWNASQALQTSETEAVGLLGTLTNQGYFEVMSGRGRSAQYQWAAAYSDLLRGEHATDLDLPLHREAVRLRIQAVLAERGRLTNEDVRRLAQASRSEAVRMMKEMGAQGLVELKGQGRGAHYVPGKSLPPKVEKARRNKKK
jgi:ATP-dependent DNA helicase RecG